MIKFYKIFFVLAFVILASCSSEKKKISIIEEDDLEFQMIDAYKEGYAELQKGDAIYAAKKFNEAELLYPQSEWASKSVLLAAYAFYSQNYYQRSIGELERFIRKYPNHKNMDYAYFLLAMCYYENIIDEKKDLEPLLLSKQKFEFILKNYPDTDFALDSKFKLNLIQDILASKMSSEEETYADIDAPVEWENRRELPPRTLSCSITSRATRGRSSSPTGMADALPLPPRMSYADTF